MNNITKLQKIELNMNNKEYDNWWARSMGYKDYEDMLKRNPPRER